MHVGKRNAANASSFVQACRVRLQGVQAAEQIWARKAAHAMPSRCSGFLTSFRHSANMPPLLGPRISPASFAATYPYKLSDPPRYHLPLRLKPAPIHGTIRLSADARPCTSPKTGGLSPLRYRAMLCPRSGRPPLDHHPRP
ncbi:hypothetical protein N658DRAFT_282529 [Parathielavia hyrcaniae]|uniref:Uncharacterized protein n=1 Tax=Parathielavia hyrcaniae TaxID=113614 RepID=A0AAN6T3D6_9PEZI|nr:hypothetical protein N658DRAFT_282529 [Parathielavia hyrcaniae]